MASSRSWAGSLGPSQLLFGAAYCGPPQVGVDGQLLAAPVEVARSCVLAGRSQSDTALPLGQDVVQDSAGTPSNLSDGAAARLGGRTLAALICSG